MGTVTKLKFKAKGSALRMECSHCGALAEARCNCGVAYIPAGDRAAAAVAATPEKSDRAIAKEQGIHRKTVVKARKKLVQSVPVTKRIGRDGKVRRLPKRPEPKISNPTKEINGFHKESVGFLTDFTKRFNAWHDDAPMISNDGKAALMEAFYLCSDGFARLAQKLDGR